MIRNSFDLDFREGIVAAHSKVNIGITFNPNAVCNMDLELECVAKERNIKGVIPT